MDNNIRSDKTNLDINIFRSWADAFLDFLFVVSPQICFTLLNDVSAKIYGLFSFLCNLRQYLFMFHNVFNMQF